MVMTEYTRPCSDKILSADELNDIAQLAGWRIGDMLHLRLQRLMHRAKYQEARELHRDIHVCLYREMAKSGLIAERKMP